LFFYAGRREQRRYLWLTGLAAPVIAVAAMILLGTASFALVGQRVRSITDAQHDPSNYFRVLDTENALNAVYESAGVGMGFGSRYRIVATVPWLAAFIQHVSRASHNGYLYLAMKMGLLGLLSWTWFWLANMGVCLGIARRTDGRFRHIGLAVTLVLIACAVANLFLPLYYNLRPMVLLALFCGLAIAAGQVERNGRGEAS
jgi:O-antigen ligase